VPEFPRRGWALVGVSAALGGAALVLTRASGAPWALGAATACVAIGFALARQAFRLARQSHARAALAASGLLLGFLAIPLFGAVALGALYLLGSR
jgi:hypothetical protein